MGNLNLNQEIARAVAPVRWVVGRVPERLAKPVHQSYLVDASPKEAVFRLSSIGRFLVRLGEPTVVQRACGATDVDIECLLRGPVSALRCCLDGQFALRGAAVDIGGRGLVIYGTAKGHSSLVAGLALAGHRIIADGVVVISEGSPHASAPPEAWPPRVTLWPDSVRALGIDPTTGTVVRSGLPSRSFALGAAPSPTPVAVKACIVLPIGYRGKSPDSVEVEPMPPSWRIQALLNAQWHPRVLRDLGMQGRHFQWLTGLAAKVPMVVLARKPRSISSTLPLMVNKAEEVLTWQE